MLIRVLSRLDVEQGVIMGWQDATRGIRIAVISITEPGARPANIFRNPWPEMPILRLEFHDVEGHEESVRLGVHRAMQPSQAAKVVDFLKTLQDRDVLVVHCEAGISRSADVAAACAVVLGQSDQEFFRYPFDPNMKCYRLVLETAGLSNRYEED
jgi:predicted protein tyrosine phosphatase